MAKCGKRTLETVAGLLPNSPLSSMLESWTLGGSPSSVQHGIQLLREVVKHVADVFEDVLGGVCGPVEAEGAKVGEVVSLVIKENS